MIEEQDEALHAPDTEPAWQESFYFNWADPDGEAFTLARIGYRPNVSKVDGLVLSIRDGELEYFYGPADLDHPEPCAEQDPAAGMRSNDLLVRMEAPLQRWRLGIEGERGMDVVFEARSPAFDYASGKLAATMTGHHFEQSGEVSGWTTFGGERREIHAFGQRDKSWGVRDWERLEGWNWIAAQFGADLSFNIMQTIEGGSALDNGFVFRDGENHPIESVAIDYEWGDAEHLMKRAEISITERGGRRIAVRAEALGSAPILRGDVWLEESHTRFEVDIGGAVRTGHGVVEHVWRVTPEQIAERAARFQIFAKAARA